MDLPGGKSYDSWLGTPFLIRFFHQLNLSWSQTCQGLFELLAKLRIQRKSYCNTWNLTMAFLTSNAIWGSLLNFSLSTDSINFCWSTSIRWLFFPSSSLCRTTSLQIHFNLNSLYNSGHGTLWSDFRNKMKRRELSNSILNASQQRLSSSLKPTRHETRLIRWFLLYLRTEHMYERVSGELPFTVA